MNEPKVSIIMSSYNTPKNYLESSIKSILNQDYENFEFIIIDDSSTINKVKDVINKFETDKIILIENEKNEGLAVSLNKGLEVSKGKYIIRMDSDDIAMSNRVSRQVKYMEEHDECDIMSGRTCLFDDNGSFSLGSSFYANSKTTISELFFDSVLLHPSVIIRRSFLAENNLQYNSNCRRAQDYDLWIRSSKKGANIQSVKDYYLFYRQHEGAASTTARKSQLEVVHRIHTELINELGINVTDDILHLHEEYCNPQETDYYNYNEISKWVLLLLKSNKRKKIYPQKEFRYVTIKRYLSGILIFTKNNKVSLFNVIKSNILFWINPKIILTSIKVFVLKIKQNKSANYHYKKYIKSIWEDEGIKCLK